MSATTQRRYRFRTGAQWGACLFERIDADAFAAQAGIAPAAPYAHAAELFRSSGAHAPAVTPTGSAVWRDGAGRLHRLEPGLDAADIMLAPHAMARSGRIVATSGGLWVIGKAGMALERYEEATLTRLDIVPVAGAPIIDIAAGGHGTLLALSAPGGIAQVVAIDCAGRAAAALVLPGIADATALACLRRDGRFVILAGDASPRLCWCAADTGITVANVAIGALRRCFQPTALGSDGHGRVFLAGADSDPAAQPCVLVFDADGMALGEIALDVRDTPPTGVTGARGSVLVTGARGLLRYDSAQRVPDGGAQVQCTLVTPMLRSPDGPEPRRWLRIEASATLPDGAALEISYAATADDQVLRRLTALADDSAVPPGLRVRRLLAEPGIWSAPMAFHGGTKPPGPTLSAPLFDVRAPYVWVCVTLTAAPGAALPILRELAVLYAGQTLMDQLPAVYRRSEAQPDSFLRSLVGVLEATTQGLDGRIAALASHVHPATAPAPWLDFVAAWLGLPWDDALEEGQKRRLVACAAELAQGRGTRAGLETLLACLMPDTPVRFRIIDPGADAGFAIVGGGNCRGSALPAMLGGHTPSSATLDFTSVLGRMRLGCAGARPDPVRALAGRIRVDIAASPAQRQAWAPWLATLIDAMLPLTARARLCWVSAQALQRGRLDGSLVLEAAPAARLDGDAVLGLARLPVRGSHITASGADIGTRLQ